MCAGPRRPRPELAPTILPKPAVQALSRALEDEYCAQGAGGVLLGAFQRERFYRAAQRRWREMARTADVAIALAACAVPSDPADGPWEQPSDDEVPDARRRFEVVWSFEPDVVTDAVEVAEQLLSPLDIGLARRLRAARERVHADADPASALRYGAAVAHRMVGYLGEIVSRPVRDRDPPAPTSSGR